MREQKEKFIAKFIHKPYTKCCEKKKEFLKSEQGLILYYLKKSANEDDYFKHYINEIKKSKPSCRTIVFYGVPIRLSKQRFSLLYLLLVDGYISNVDYLQISNLCNNKKSKKISDNNLKSFISKFKSYIITQYTKNKRTDDKFIEDKFNNLVYYNEHVNGYIIRTKFEVFQKEHVKKQK